MNSAEKIKISLTQTPRSVKTCHIPFGSRVLVSACLLGLNTRYSGLCKTCPPVEEFLHTYGLIPIPVCPEQLGGLPTPRSPSAFRSGDGNAVLENNAELIDRNGENTSHAFKHGARQCHEIARVCACSWAIFKERSPSCGTNQVYLGDHLINGQGVTTALLHRNGVNILSEENIIALAPEGFTTQT